MRKRTFVLCLRALSDPMNNITVCLDGFSFQFGYLYKDKTTLNGFIFGVHRKSGKEFCQFLKPLCRVHNKVHCFQKQYVQLFPALGSHMRTVMWVTWGGKRGRVGWQHWVGLAGPREGGWWVCWGGGKVAQLSREVIIVQSGWRR